MSAATTEPANATAKASNLPIDTSAIRGKSSVNNAKKVTKPNKPLAKPRSKLTVATAPCKASVKQGSTLPVIGHTSSKPLMRGDSCSLPMTISAATLIATNIRTIISLRGTCTPPLSVGTRGISSKARIGDTIASDVATMSGNSECNCSVPNSAKLRVAPSRHCHQTKRLANQAKVTI